MKNPKKHFYSLFFFAFLIVLFSGCSDSDEPIEDEIIEEDSWRIKEIRGLGEEQQEITFNYIDGMLESTESLGFCYGYGYTYYGSLEGERVVYTVDEQNGAIDISVMVPDRGVIRNQRDEYIEGRIVRQSIGGSITSSSYSLFITYEYDASGKIKNINSKVNKGGFEDVFNYARNGNLATTTSNSGDYTEKTNIDYNYKGDLLMWIAVEKDTISYQYDVMGRVSRVTLSNWSDGSEYIYDIIYDENSNPSKVTEMYQSGQGAAVVEGEYYFIFEMGKTNYNFIPMHEMSYANNLMNGTPWWWIFDL